MQRTLDLFKGAAEWAHEVRTHVQVLMAAVAILEAGHLSEGQQKEYYSILKRNTGEMLEITNRVMEADSLMSRPARMEIIRGDTLLHDCAVSVRPAADAAKIRVLEDLQPGLELWADRRMLERVIYNLLINAIKYTPAGGYLHIAAERRYGLIEITVSDTGCGISEEKQARLFQRLTDERAGGHGLGLCFVQGLVEKMQGRVRCVSRLNEGTTFLVTLPGDDAAHGGLAQSVGQ